MPPLAMRRFSVALACCVLMLLSVSSRVATQGRKPMSAIRLYTGADGMTHAETIDLRLTPSSLLDGTERSDRIKVTALQIVRWPPGHVNDWHNASETPGGHQYVLTLSGRGEVEIAGGQRLPLEPGRILLGEDLTGKGHITRTLGSEDWVSAHVSIED